MAHPSPETNTARPTRTVENYLMSMHVMERDQGEIVAARLAEVLQVAPATVAMTLKRMERDGWISLRSRGKGIHLTDTGRQAAFSVIRRHMLTEWLLVNMLKMPILDVHAEAHNLEHAISPQLEERLVQLLGNPQVCPHGNPFPGQEQATRDWLPLTDLPGGTQATIRRLHELAEENQELLAFLYHNGLQPGSRVRLVESLPFNQTLSVETNQGNCTLGFQAARLVYAQKLP